MSDDDKGFKHDRLKENLVVAAIIGGGAASVAGGGAFIGDQVKKHHEAIAMTAAATSACNTPTGPGQFPEEVIIAIPSSKQPLGTVSLSCEAVNANKGDRDMSDVKAAIKEAKSFCAREDRPTGTRATNFQDALITCNANEAKTR